MIAPPCARRCEPPRLEVADLGRRDYVETWELQRALVAARAPGRASGHAGAGRASPRLHARPPRRRGESRARPGRRAGAGGRARGRRHVSWSRPARRLPHRQARAEPSATCTVPARARGGAHPRARAGAGLAAERRPGLTGRVARRQKVASTRGRGPQLGDLPWLRAQPPADLGYFRPPAPCGLSADLMSSLAERLGRPVAADGCATRWRGGGRGVRARAWMPGRASCHNRRDDGRGEGAAPPPLHLRVRPAHQGEPAVDAAARGAGEAPLPAPCGRGAGKAVAQVGASPRT